MEEAENCFDEYYRQSGRWPGPTLAEIEQLREQPKPADSEDARRRDQ